MNRPKEGTLGTRWEAGMALASAAGAEIFGAKRPYSMVKKPASVNYRYTEAVSWVASAQASAQVAPRSQES